MHIFMMSEKVGMALCNKMYKLSLIYDFINVPYLSCHSPTLLPDSLDSGWVRDACAMHHKWMPSSGIASITFPPVTSQQVTVLPNCNIAIWTLYLFILPASGGDHAAGRWRLPGTWERELTGAVCAEWQTRGQGQAPTACWPRGCGKLYSCDWWIRSHLMILKAIYTFTAFIVSGLL